MKHHCPFLIQPSKYGPVIELFRISSRLIVSSKIQLYRDGAFLPWHTDDNPNDIIHFVIYLNNKTSAGGELCITNRNDDSEEYIPSFGDLVMIDLIQGKPVAHSVKKTYWDRFVMAGYVKRKNNE